MLNFIQIGRKGTKLWETSSASLRVLRFSPDRFEQNTTVITGNMCRPHAAYDTPSTPKHTVNKYQQYPIEYLQLYSLTQIIIILPTF